MMINSAVETPANSYALVGGTLFDSHTGSLNDGKALWVEGDRIRAVAAPDDLPVDIKRVDITDKYVIPGMVDVHVHSEDWHAPLYLAKGVTSVRDVGCELETSLRRRNEWNDSNAVAPRLVITGPVIDCPGNQWTAMTHYVNTPAEARAAVDMLVEHGVDQIKPYAFLTWQCFEAIIDQAHHHGKFTVAHLGKRTNARRAIEAGLDEIEHLSGISEAMWSEENDAAPDWNWMYLWSALDRQRMDKMIDLIVERGTWMAITRLIWQRLATLWDTRLLDHPQLDYIPTHLRSFWNTFINKPMPPELRRLRSAQVAGAQIFAAKLIERCERICVGTDTPLPHLTPGFCYHDELWALLECGMSESALLQAATLQGAKAIELDRQIGSLDAGKYADMLILDSNPLVDMRVINQLTTVIRGGQFFESDALLAQAKTFAQSNTPYASTRFNDIW
ncbi:MAG: amidohydrolase family protein [Anaerolineae bacterium]|nr:amidohydrolase family protein [Anaerolineae bacterium]